MIESEDAVLEYRLADKSIAPLVDLTIQNKKSNSLGVNSDLEAMSVWLSRYANEHTIKAYYKDVNRFIYWLTFIGGKNLQNFTINDLNKYIAFLKNPPDTWCMPEKKYKRYDIKWRPFNGPLQKNALNYAITVLNSLFSFLENAGYINKNPVKLLQRKNVFAQREEQKVKVWERTLDDYEWQAVIEVLADLPEKSQRDKLQKIKTQLLFACLYVLGLRIHEAANARYTNLQYVNNAWWFVLYGKGDKLGTIPVNSQFINILQEYRKVQNLSLDFIGDDSYLFQNNYGAMVTTRTLYNMVKHVGQIASEKFANSYQREKLQNLSPHWLRHLSATHQSRLGTPMEIIKDNHRHSSIQTTQIYMHSDNDLRQHFMQQHMLNMTVGLNNLNPIDPIIPTAKIGTTIKIKFLHNNPPSQFVDTVLNHISKQLLANFVISDEIKNSMQEYLIILNEENIQVNFDSVAIISKVWGIDVEISLF